AVADNAGVAGPSQALHLTGAAEPAPAGELCRSASEASHRSRLMSESPLRVIRPLVVPAQFFVSCLWCLLLTGLPALLVSMLWERMEESWFTPMIGLLLLLGLLGGLSVALLPVAAVRFLLDPRYTEYKV